MAAKIKQKRLFIIESVLALLLLLCMVLIWPGKLLLRTTYESASVEKQLEANIAISDSSTVMSEFVPIYADLNSISVKLGSTQEPATAGTISCTVYDSYQKVLAETELPISDLSNGQYLTFPFDLTVVPNSVYYYSLSTDSLDVDSNEKAFILLYSGSPFTGSPEYRSLSVNSVDTLAAPAAVFSYQTAPSLQESLPYFVVLCLIGVLLFGALYFATHHYRGFIALFACIAVFCLILLSDESNRPINVTGGNLTKLNGTSAYDTLYISEDSGYSGAFGTSDTFSLMKGTYTIGIEYSSTGSADSFSILANDAVAQTFTLQPELKYQTFDFTLDHDIEEIQFQFNYGGTGTLILYSFNLSAKNGFYQDSYYLAGLFVLLVSIACIYYLIRKYGIGKSHLCKRDSFTTAEKSARYARLGILLLGLIASLPLFTSNLSWGEDLAYHLVRIEGIKDGLLDRQFPVLIYPEGLNGHGYLNAMYPNLFLYIPAVLRIIGVSIAMSYKTLLILASIATAGLTYISVKSLRIDRKIAILAAAVYTLSPYRFTNLYARGALGEALAMTFLPLVLAGIYHVLLGERKRYWMLILGMSGLIQTHILSAMLGTIICLIAGMICIANVIREKRVLLIIKSVLYTILLNLWFIVPFVFFYIKGDLWTSALDWSRYSEYSINLSELLGTLTGGDYRSLTLGIPVVLLGCCALYYLIEAGKDSTEQKPRTYVTILLTVAACLTFMMSSQFAGWNMMQIGWIKWLLKNIQFPWRLLGMISAICIVIGAYSLSRTKKLQPYRNAIVITLIAIALLSSAASYSENMPYASYSSEYTTGHYTKVHGILKGTSAAVYPFEWRTNGTTDEVAAVQDIIPSSSEIVISDVSRAGTSTTFSASCAYEYQSVIMPITYYYGYQVTDENRNEIGFNKSSTGQIQIGLYGDGELHTYYVDYVGSIVFDGATWISGLALIGLGIVGIIRRRKGRA